jgi:LDH2 family malate/lactate/ureidoglycolate dehydrogenase
LNIACHVRVTTRDRSSVAAVAVISIDELRSALHARAVLLGFPAAAAALITDHFLDAELRGAPTHGAERMRWLSGFTDLAPTARPREVERTEGLVRWDGAGAVGYVALAEALDAELDAAPDGARLVVVSHCFPTGRLGWFAERVARRGLVCLLTATSTARIVHPDGGPALLGTNPLCLALPGADGPTVVDVSMGAVTYGAVLHAAATGGELPEGVLRRTDGGAETDPHAVIADRAGIVPMGADLAYKGFALATIVELLCGSLAGTDGFAAVALIAAPQAEPVTRLRALVDGRRFPGERSAAALAAARRRGTVTVPDDLWAWLEGRGR